MTTRFVINGLNTRAIKAEFLGILTESNLSWYVLIVAEKIVQPIVDLKPFLLVEDFPKEALIKDNFIEVIPIGEFTFARDNIFAKLSVTGECLAMEDVGINISKNSNSFTISARGVDVAGNEIIVAEHLNFLGIFAKENDPEIPMKWLEKHLSLHACMAVKSGVVKGDHEILGISEWIYITQFAKPELNCCYPQ